MKRFLATAILLALSARTAQAEWSAATPRVVVRAGYWAPLNIPFIAFRGICDDARVVRTEVRGGGVGVTGLTEGRTLCGYWGAAPRYLLFDVTVIQ